jgi:hypothetical protein
MDPVVAARCFVGPLVTHFLSRLVLQLPDAQEIEPATLVAGNVAIFLNGLKPGR